jgi:autotransporter-associated beta strand protein
VTKLGGGTLVLDKTNTYTGATTVSAGKLVVSGNISTSTLTTVAVGATLGGTGTVGKAIINGTLVVGNSPGQMNFTDTLGLNGTTVMEIDGTAGAGVTGGHDFINLTGAGAAGVLTYGGAMTLDIGAIFGAGTYSWNLFDMASETGTYTTITLADQYSGTLLDGDLNGVWDLTSGSNTWQFTESTGVLGLTVVPEPSVAALLGGIGTLMLLRRRRA